MKVIFRVDASNQMGIGHLMRCLTLAEALCRRGVEVGFISREHPGNLCELFQQRAIPVVVLPAPKRSHEPVSGCDYATWLGISQEEDAQQTIEALQGENPDWLVVDHYGLDVKWEQRLRPNVKRLMVIDDLANRHHDCELLLDQNYSIEGESRYLGLVPDACKLLVGTPYALLRPEYALYRYAAKARRKQIETVLVYFGGPDPHNMTGLVLRALSSADLSQLNVIVVIGINNLHKEILEKQARQRPRTDLHAAREHLADLMSEADLAIGACGATTWERMCLGLPAIVISISDNQRPAADALKKRKLITYAGHFDEIKSDQIECLVKTYISEKKTHFEAVLQNQIEVDGLGTLRVVEVLVPSQKADLRLRPAAARDILSYFSWANDPMTGKNAMHSDPIGWETHMKWYQSKLGADDSHLFILEAGELPIGQIRFDVSGNEALVDYSLDPIVRGRGWGAKLIKMGADLMQITKPVRLRADVKAGNHASSSAFLRLGFSKKALCADTNSGGGYSISILSDRTSWINEYINNLQLDWIRDGHRVLWVHDVHALQKSDFCFYLGCSQVAPSKALSLFKHNLVVHESALPKGKGWSPLTWQILEGKNRIPITLIEASDQVDSGVIYLQRWLNFKGDELVDELRAKQSQATVFLCKSFVHSYPKILSKARQQKGRTTWYKRRQKKDSQINTSKSLKDIFTLMRVADNYRYPLFFNINKSRYMLQINKITTEDAK
jgi:UDP-2,4-diacetamido-2,4,6-trideoxy-beta-L-altropyranose hydrolase